MATLLAAPVTADAATLRQSFETILNTTHDVDTQSTFAKTITTNGKAVSRNTEQFHYFDSSLGTLRDVHLRLSGRLTNEHTSSGVCSVIPRVPSACSFKINSDSYAHIGVDLAAVTNRIKPPARPGDPLSLDGELIRAFRNLSDFSAVGLLLPKREDAKRVANFNVSTADLGMNENFVGAGFFDAIISLGSDADTTATCGFAAATCNARTTFANGARVTVTLDYIYDPFDEKDQPPAVPLPAGLPMLLAALGAFGLIRKARG